MSGLEATSQLRLCESLTQKCSRKVRQSDAKNYCDRLYSSSGTHSWYIYCVITWDLKLHIAVNGKVRVDTG